MIFLTNLRNRVNFFMQLKIETVRDQIPWYPVYRSHSVVQRIPQFSVTLRRIILSLSIECQRRRMHDRSAPHHLLSAFWSPPRYCKRHVHTRLRVCGSRASTLAGRQCCFSPYRATTRDCRLLGDRRAVPACGGQGKWALIRRTLLIFISVTIANNVKW